VTEGDAALPPELLEPPRGPYRSLSPATKVVVGLSEAAIAFFVGAWTGPLLVLATVLVSAAIARVLRALMTVALLAFTVIGAILLVNTFFLPGATDEIVRIGPLAPTWSGLRFGVQVALRLLAFSLSLVLIYLTTGVEDLLDDLERRGLGRRPVFVIGSATRLVPRMAQRGRDVIEAQRARGLDTEGRIWRRASGLLPLATPLVLGAITDVEEQTMALEARAFTAPGRRTPLRTLPDTSSQRILRWTLGAATATLVLLSVTGRLAVP
jgi:energy-coupling factor transport system permease protein